MKKQKLDFPAKDNIENAMHCKQIWLHVSIIWNVVDVLISTLAFSASIAAILVEIFVADNKIWIIVLSTVTATLTFISAVVNPKQHVRAYRKACELVNSSLLLYHNNDDEKKACKDVVDAIIKGEELIGSTYELV